MTLFLNSILFLNTQPLIPMTMLFQKNTDYRRIPAVYTKIANNYTENIVKANQIFNDMPFSYLQLFKNWVQNSKQYLKHFINEGKKNLQAYEERTKKVSIKQYNLLLSY